MPDPIAFAQPTNNQIHISPQLALATFQFLQTGELRDVWWVSVVPVRGVVPRGPNNVPVRGPDACLEM